MDKAKLHDNSDENKRVSPKCGSKTIDLGKSRSIFAQMWVKNHRFGQKVQQEGTHADSGRRARSMLFHALPVAVPLSLASPPPFHTFPPLQKRAFFRKLKTSDFFGQNIGTFEAKVRYFYAKKSDVFIFRNGTFQPCRHRPSPPKAVDKGGSRRKNGSRKDFSAGLRKKQKHG